MIPRRCFDLARVQQCKPPGRCHGYRDVITFDHSTLHSEFSLFRSECVRALGSDDKY